MKIRKWYSWACVSCHMTSFAPKKKTCKLANFILSVQPAICINSSRQGLKSVAGMKCSLNTPGHPIITTKKVDKAPLDNNTRRWSEPLISKVQHFTGPNSYGFDPLLTTSVSRRLSFLPFRCFVRASSLQRFIASSLHRFVMLFWRFGSSS